MPGNIGPPQPPPNNYPPQSGPPTQAYTHPQGPFDTTGQTAPPGMKPRVTATLWEDEGSLCFQVEAKGVCVARREGKVQAVARWDDLLTEQITTLSMALSF